MEPLDYWRFCHELTVVQAGLLIIGLDPTPHFGYVSRCRPEEQPSGYAAVFAALQNDILTTRLPAMLLFLANPYDPSVDIADWDRTLVSVEDLKAWLSKRGVKTGFFFPDGPVAAEYLDRCDPNFSPKLAAAVEAWKAVKAQRAMKPSGKSVKTDLTKWLNIRASEYGLANETGEPNKLAIEEVSKVANWDHKGGAPRTPGN